MWLVYYFIFLVSFIICFIIVYAIQVRREEKETQERCRRLEMFIEGSSKKEKNKMFRKRKELKKLKKEQKEQEKKQRSYVLDEIEKLKEVVMFLCRGDKHSLFIRTCVDIKNHILYKSTVIKYLYGANVETYTLDYDCKVKVLENDIEYAILEIKDYGDTEIKKLIKKYNYLEEITKEYREIEKLKKKLEEKEEKK